MFLEMLNKCLDQITSASWDSQPAVEHLAVFLDSRCIDNGEAINLNLNNFSTAIRFCSKARQ